jgi:hypothetical protein
MNGAAGVTEYFAHPSDVATRSSVGASNPTAGEEALNQARRANDPWGDLAGFRIIGTISWTLHQML